MGSLHANGNLWSGEQEKRPLILPICAFKKDYPELGGDFEAMHYSKVLGDPFKKGKLSRLGELAKKITFHNSCYHDCHIEVYDAPSEHLQAVPGAELVAMRS